MDVPALEARLGHRFADPALLRQALTHSSYGTDNYERLEFVGDALLDFVIASELYRRFPSLPEGRLHRLRAELVNQPALHERALWMGLPALLRVAAPLARAGGQEQASVLADAAEAVLGAVLEDAGFEAAREVVLRAWADPLAALDPEAPLKDPKTRLQEWLQARGHALPAYRVSEVAGEPHRRRFTVICEVPVLGVETSGRGTTRRAAEQEAARAALARAGEA